jgi:hypothetical protein
MPWQGNANVLIDRFDVRAHLDIIPEVQNTSNSFPEENKDMRNVNYERYRILIQNNFLKSELFRQHFLKIFSGSSRYIVFYSQRRKVP